MRSLRFLVTRRWILLLLVVVFLSALSWRLGIWQFHRLAERKASNAIIEGHIHQDPVPVGDVLAVGRPATEAQEWTRVTATGTYAASRTVVIRYQVRNGELGADLVVPLTTTTGPDLIVDRGWIAVADRTPSVADLPAPPSGTVTVTGWVRLDGTGSSTHVSDQSARAVSSAAIASALHLRAYGGFLDVDHETPPPAKRLAGTVPPDLGNGPHFFYGLQWWFFSLLAVFGYLYLAYDEWRGGGASRRAGSRTGRTEQTEERRAQRLAQKRQRQQARLVKAQRTQARKDLTEQALARERAQAAATAATGSTAARAGGPVDAATTDASSLPESSDR